MFPIYYPIDDIIVGNLVHFSERIQFIRLKFFCTSWSRSRSWYATWRHAWPNRRILGGGPLGLVLPCIETVGCGSGQCFPQITESCLIVMFVYGIAFNHREYSDLSRGSRNTGVFCSVARHPFLLR